MFILGGFAVSSGLLTIAFLPETLGAGLPEVKIQLQTQIQIQKHTILTIAFLPENLGAGLPEVKTQIRKHHGMQW